MRVDAERIGEVKFVSFVFKTELMRYVYFLYLKK